MTSKALPQFRPLVPDQPCQSFYLSMLELWRTQARLERNYGIRVSTRDFIARH
jgi:hypothetical protein